MRNTDRYKGPQEAKATRVQVLFSRFDGSLRLCRPGGGPLEGLVNAFADVWERVSDKDAVPITGRWSEQGRAVPCGMAPAAFVQTDVDWSESARQEFGVDIGAAGGGKCIPKRVSELLGLFGVPPAGPDRLWTCCDNGRLATFSPLLLDGRSEQPLQTAIACWLACTYTLAVGHAQAARRRQEVDAPFRRRETEPLLHEIDCGHRYDSMDPDIVRQWRVSLLTVECRLYLADLWSGRQR